MSDFSVLMSVYHRERGEFLRAALESVFSQTAPPEQVVLVQDGPLTPELDGVCDEFARQYPTQMTIVPLPENAGLGAALNAGLTHCRHELVARMDSDDLSLPTRFEQQLDAFKANPALAVVGGWIEEFDDDPNVVTDERRLPAEHADIARFFRRRSPLNHVTVMFRRSAVESVGGYEPFYLVEDYWLWGRLLAAGFLMHNIQKPLVRVRGGRDMFARRAGWKYAMSEVRLMRRFRQIGVIGWGDFFVNFATRFPVRVMPAWLRTWVYRKLLR